MTVALAADPVLGLADALIGRWAATQAPIVEKATARALTRWGALDVYSGDEVFRFGKDMAALSTAVQGASRNLMFGYLRSVLSALGSPVGQRVLIGAAALVAIRAGVELARVYERPAKQVRYLQSTGVAYDLARTEGARRLETLLDADAHLASRQAANELLGKLGGGGGGRDGSYVRGYRRIVRPELSRGLPCGLCVVAADQIYSVDELLPLHNGCHCTVMPIVARNGKVTDPGQVLNETDLATIYDAAGGSTGRAELQRVRVAVRQHGEVGPVLVDADQHFKRRPKPEPRNRQREVEAQIVTAEGVIVDLRRRAAAGEDVSRPMKYQTEQLAWLRAERGGVLL